MGLSIVDKLLESQGQLTLAVLNPTGKEATFGKPFFIYIGICLIFLYPRSWVKKNE